MMSPVTVELGERIVAYFDVLGGVEGQVVRNFEGGFALEFTATRHRREKLAAQLTWLINANKVPGLEQRRHERVIPKNAASTLKIGEAEPVPVQVLDVSISGASVAIKNPPPVGTDVVLGKLRGRIVRHHDQGVGIEFLDIQAPTALRRYFG